MGHMSLIPVRFFMTFEPALTSKPRSVNARWHFSFSCPAPRTTRLDTDLPTTVVPTIKSVIVEIVSKARDYVDPETRIKYQIDARAVMSMPIPVRGSVGRRTSITPSVSWCMRRRAPVEVIATSEAEESCQGQPSRQKSSAFH